MPRVVIAGTASGVGKTSITCSVIYGLKKLGYEIQPFKAGPDYIDPSYLSSVSGRPARNLDVWLMGRKRLFEEFTRISTGNISVIEGVMGYYDGFSGENSRCSTHHVAEITKSPAILILDAAGAARSVAATALGFTRFHKGSRIAGVILNRVSSTRHEFMCREALWGLRIPVVGAIPKNPEFSLKSRHLGLIPASEQQGLRKKIMTMVRSMSEFLDLDQIVKIAKSAVPLQRPKLVKSKKPECIIAVALDDSFNFYYHSNLESLRRAGAEIIFFSPISDERPPKCDGIYIGGGFPEVLSEPLSKNHTMKTSIKRLAEDGIPLYAECGGLMYLTRSIHDGARRLPMVDLLDADTEMTKKMTLNYTKARVVSRCILFAPGRMFRGHEFHYSKLSCTGDVKFAYELELGSGISKEMDGIVQYNTLASYCHLFLDTKNITGAFVSTCKDFSRR